MQRMCWRILSDRDKVSDLGSFDLKSRFLPQVTTLVNTSNKGPSSKKKGRSKKAHVLAMSVEQATQNFLEKGEQIAKDSQDLKEELITAVEEVRKQGEGSLPDVLGLVTAWWWSALAEMYQRYLVICSERHLEARYFNSWPVGWF